MEGKTHVTDPTGKCIDLTLYRNMIGSLPYITTSRPNILLSIGVYARFRANPKESHLTAVKKILKYLSVTIDYDIWYSRDTNLSIVGYLNTDWACVDDRKSTSGGCFYVGRNLVVWMSKK